MKIDTALKNFMEKYDDKAIASIDKLSNNFAGIVNNKKISVYNMKKCFESFCEFLSGYAQYKIDNINNPEASPQDAIQKSTQSFIESDILKEVELPYNELPNFIIEYMEGIKALTKTVDDSKQLMLESNVDADSIGDVNTFADNFMERVSKAFDEGMSNLLWASGYTANQRLIERKVEAVKSTTSTPVFL